MENKIIQIIPAPKALWAVYAKDSGERVSQVVCLALTATGKVMAMDTFGGHIDFCDDEFSCFKGFRKYSSRE